MKKIILSFLIVFLGTATVLQAQKTTIAQWGKSINVEHNSYSSLFIPDMFALLNSTQLDLLRSATFEYYDEEEWMPMFRNEYDYQNGLLTDWITQYLNFATLELENYERHQISYSGNLMTEHITSDWNSSSESWIPDIRTTFNYANIGGVMRQSQVITYMWINQTWVLDTRITMDYTNNQFRGFLDEKYVNGQWIPYLKVNVAIIPDQGLFFVEQMWQNEVGWINDYMLVFPEYTSTNEFLRIMPLLFGLVYTGEDGTIQPPNLSEFYWILNSVPLDEFNKFTHTEYYWNGSEWVKEFRVIGNPVAPIVNFFDASFIASIYTEYFDGDEWFPEFMAEFYLDENQRLIGVAEYEAYDSDELEIYGTEEYIYEDDLLKTILKRGMENGDVYDDLTLYARVSLVWSGDFVNTETDPQLPNMVKLYPSYPNPFNPTTTISFELPTDMHVDLNVYNIQGQLVATLANSVFTSGKHSVTFDATGLSSGVYIYQLNGNGVRLSQKMTLIK